MVARVGDFLRASLRDGGATCLLRDEIELARSYVEIQRLRFEGAIDAELAVAPGLGGRAVPRLVLQPLVENAIKHTMVGPERPLVLRIEAMPHGDGLRLQVANSRGGNEPPSDGTGRGLDLVRSRLALLYGDAASLSVDESDPAWYRVFVILPAQGRRPPAPPWSRRRDRAHPDRDRGRRAARAAKARAAGRGPG